MNPRQRKQSLALGGLLIVLGVMALVESFSDVSPWAWVAVLAASGLVTLVIYLTERSAWGLLIQAYVLLAVAVLVTLAVLEVADPLIPVYILVSIALPFLAVFLRNRANWWALIPAYVLIVIAIMIGLTEWNVMPDVIVAPYILTSIALPFLVVFLHNRANWWALIPAYVLLIVGAMVALIEVGVLNDMLVPAYIMFAIAVPFLVIYARNRTQWWALIPGGVLVVIGSAFLLTTQAAQFIGAVALVIVGIVILVLQFTRKK